MCIEQTYLLTELFRYTYHGINNFSKTTERQIIL